VYEHGEALEYDLMTMAHMTLDDMGGALSLRALRSFVRRLGPGSELWRETHDESDDWLPWLDGTMVAPMLVSLLDSLNLQRWEYALSCTTKGRTKPRKPKPTSVPWRDDASRERHIGHDPIPISEFDQWWDSFDQ
jgi:hypothetical protein